MKLRASLALAFVLGLAASTTADAAPGAVVTVAGSQGQGDGNEQLDQPIAIALGPDGALYVSDYSNGRVQKVELNASGVATSTSTVLGGTVSAPLNGPFGIAFDPNGVMYLAETGENRILRIVFDDPANPTITTVAGQATLGAGDVLSTPRGIALAPDGALFIANTFGFNVRRLVLDTDGVPQSITTVVDTAAVGAGFWMPQGLAIDDNGVVYLAAAATDRIYRFTVDAGGTPSAITITAGTGTPYEVNAPNGLAFDLDGSLFVAGVNDNTVRRLTLDGSGIATSSEIVGGQNGEGSGPGQLEDPNGVAVTANGSLIINDALNHRVLSFVSDVTGPVLEVPDYGTIREDAPITLRFDCSDPGGAGVDTCTATRNGVPITDGTIFTPGSPGVQTIVVTSVDQAGNPTTQTWTVTVYGSRELTGDYAELTGEPGSVARLYMAAFHREPEQTGFDYWTTETGTGRSMRSVAEYFVTSPEMFMRQGILTDSELVDLLYTNVMGRPADAPGRAFWMSELADGMSQAELLLLFSDTSEFRTLSNSD